MGEDFEEEREEYIRTSSTAGTFWQRYLGVRHPAARSYRRARKRNAWRRDLIVAVVFVVILFGSIGLALLLAQR